MGALEQEPLYIQGFVTSGALQTVAVLPCPGTANDTAFGLGIQPGTPFDKIRVRGLIWVTGTAATLSVSLLNSSLFQVLQTYSNPATPLAADVPLPFEWVDVAPTGTPYYIQAITSVASVVSLVANIEGFAA
jgi:hypothetical protein